MASEYLYDNEKQILNMQISFKLFLMKEFPLYNFKYFIPDLFTDNHKIENFFLKEGHGEKLIIQYYLYKTNCIHWSIMKEEKIRYFDYSKSIIDEYNVKSELINTIIEMDKNNIKKLSKILDFLDEED